MESPARAAHARQAAVSRSRVSFLNGRKSERLPSSSFPEDEKKRTRNITESGKKR